MCSLLSFGLCFFFFFAGQVMKAIKAGIDVVMVPGDYKGFASNLTYLVQKGLVKCSA